MKNYFIILNLLLSSALAYQITTYEPLPMYGYCPCHQSPYNNQIQRFYNPYSNYSNPYYRNYTATRLNYPNQNRVRRIKKFQKRRFNTLSFLNRNNNGFLTGYSLPINKNDIYGQMGISPYNPKAKQKYNSINCNQELFSTPSGDEMYYKNGEYYKDLNGVSGKTGVTIIYD